MGLYPESPKVYLTGIPRGKLSRVFVVDPVNGVDTNSGEKFEAPLLTVRAALAKCTAGRHDAVVVIGANTAVLEAAAIDWNKDYTHLVGLCAKGAFSQRARIVCNAVDLSPFFTISAKGCIVKDLEFWQGQDDVHSLVCVSVTGSRNYFQNVHFAGGGHVTQAIDGCASLYLNGAQECLFEDCTFGIDTIAAGNGEVAVLMDNSATRIVFKNSLFNLFAGNAGARWLEIVSNMSIDRLILFENCKFINLAATTMASAFQIPAGVDANNKRFLLKSCVMIGATDWDANNRGLMFLDMVAPTSGGDSGIALVSATA